MTQKKLEHILYMERISKKARSDFDRAYLGKGKIADIED